MNGIAGEHEARRLMAGRVAWRGAWARRVVVLLTYGIAVLFWSGLGVSPAWARYEEVGTFPRVPEEESLGALPLSKDSAGVATDDATGEVYVADGDHARVERFSSEGRFLGAWGWDTIKTGPGKAGRSLKEKVTIERTSGGEDVVYKGARESETKFSETKPLSYEASAEVVKKELETLLIESNGESSVKGKINVVKTGSGAYEFEYPGEGALGDTRAEAISVEKEGLEGTIKRQVEQGEPAFEDCVVANGDVCRKLSSGVQGGNPGEFVEPRSVAVDQVSGDVYVLDSEHPKVVQVFTADGERTGIEFGENTAEKLGEVGEPEKNPEELRAPNATASELEGIAVDPEGDSYIVNAGVSAKQESRVSVFDSTGEYVGSMGRTCGAKFATGCRLQSVGVDSAGNVYAVGEEEQVFEFQHGSEPTTEPVCELQAGIPNLESLAVDGSGEVVVYGNVSHELYWLEGCVEGKFEEEPLRDFEAKAVPPAKNTTALAWDPTLRYPAARAGFTRPEGVFYAINPAFFAPKTELNTGLIFAQPEQQEKPAPPKVVAESVSDVGLASATFDARVEPYPDPVRYRFRYYSPEDLKCSELHECEVPLGGSELELRAGGELVSEPVSGLVSGATYHFEVVGYSLCNPEDPAEECPLEGGLEREFTTFPAGSVGLPDGRAYELVSPPVTDGGEVFPPDESSLDCDECLPGTVEEKFPMQSTPNGEEMVYEGYPFAATGDAVNENEYFAARTPGGWATRDLSPASAVRAGPIAGYKVFSPDLSFGVFVQEGAALSPEAPEDGSVAYPDVYLQSTSAPEDPRPLWTKEDAEAAPPHRGPEGTDAEELRFVVGGMAGGHVIFAANDALTPNAVDGGPSANLYDWVEGRLRLVNVLPDGSTQPGAVFGSGEELGASDPDYAHAISADGSRIFWTDSENHQVYVRVDGEETIEVPDAGLFLTASADGSKVLLNDGHVYDLETEEVVDLTGGMGGFQGLLGASEDLSRVYFIDTEVLPGVEADTRGSRTAATAGGDNLYLWQEGSPVRYIATLSSGDDEDSSAVRDWVASPSNRTAQVTSDGGYAAFMSRASLTGYDNASASEVFEYDAGSNALVCASCNPTKQRPVGGSVLSLIEPGSGFMAQPSNLADDGRVFFDSDDALSPGDAHPGVENVFEYEPGGVGSCGSGEGGCVFMISSGTGETDSSFVNATPSGSDVFFTTRSRLVAQDQDGLMALYDAREGGGFAAAAPVQPCTDSETCQGSPSPSAVFESSLGATLPGLGNVASSPAPSPSPPSSSSASVRHLTRAQLLANALRSCRRARSGRARRLACERSARGRYGRPAGRKQAASGRGARGRGQR
jgi:DNA-binding beta-propeller fold protein YncE